MCHFVPPSIPYFRACKVETQKTYPVFVGFRVLFFQSGARQSVTPSPKTNMSTTTSKLAKLTLELKPLERNWMIYIIGGYGKTAPIRRKGCCLESVCNRIQHVSSRLSLFFLRLRSSWYPRSACRTEENVASSPNCTPRLGAWRC